ncbi:hypothetical protein LCGC14_1037900 [marine sediment metagenome]|uniref:Secretion system C-terminal sorting domain-containing protein n=1 Tax=marine sediment metagenome TaxID=412755 RepID=A0A0F9NEB9_9ZZZZ
MVAKTFSYAQSAGCEELFFSEYIDGPFKNKVLEIYNPKDSTVNLAVAGYSIKIFQNGAPTPLEIHLFGTIPSKETYVVSHFQADSAVLSKADMVSPMMNFDGNDAIVLNRGQSTYVDKIGEIGVDPGNSGWFVPPNGSTKEHDLRRKLPVDRGQPDWVQGKTEWNVHPKDSVANLKKHVSKCAAVAVYVQFAVTSSSVVENIWPDKAHISITISQADPDYSTTVDILDGVTACNIGTQTADFLDYSFPGSQTFTWLAGQSSPIDVQIDINDDNLIEGDETVCLEMTLQNTNPNAYLGSNAFHVLTIVDDDGTGIEKYDMSNKIKISPNPVNDEMIINLDAARGIDFEWIKITTLLGEEAVTMEPAKSIDKLELNVSSLSSGMYFITFTNDDRTYTKKFIKK